MGLHLVHGCIVKSLTATQSFCKIYIFDSILFIFEFDGGPIRRNVTMHTKKIWGEMRFVKPIPIYDTLIRLVKRCRRRLVMTESHAWPRDCRASVHQAVRRLTAKSREVSKPRDWMLQWSYRSEIWQAPRQQRCRGTCQISERLEKSKPESRGFEASRDLAVRRLTA